VLTQVAGSLFLSAVKLGIFHLNTYCILPIRVDISFSADFLWIDLILISIMVALLPSSLSHPRELVIPHSSIVWQATWNDGAPVVVGHSHGVDLEKTLHTLQPEEGWRVMIFRITAVMLFFAPLETASCSSP